MTEVKQGDKVRVQYKGKLNDGTEFDSTEGRDPMEITIGAGEVIAGFEEALIGMKQGEAKTFELAPDAAYGNHDPEIVQSIPRQAVPDEIELAQGLVLEITDPDGQVYGMTVVEFDDESVTLDANHPLAGHDLTFEVVLVDIT